MFQNQATLQFESQKRLQVWYIKKLVLFVCVSISLFSISKTSTKTLMFWAIGQMSCTTISKFGFFVNHCQRQKVSLLHF